MSIDKRMCLVKTLLGKTLWDQNLVKEKEYIILYNIVLRIFYFSPLGMAMGRGGHGFRYPIPIPVKKIHPHPHTQTQRVLNFWPIPIPTG